MSLFVPNGNDGAAELVLGSSLGSIHLLGVRQAMENSEIEIYEKPKGEISSLRSSKKKLTIHDVATICCSKDGKNNLAGIAVGHASGLSLLSF